MHFSATSYIMAILVGNCLICFLCIIMKNKRVAQRMNIRFLKYFSFFILLRLMLPFEFIHTITIPSEKILPIVMDFFNEYVLFTIKTFAITPSLLFLSVWIIGVIYILCSAVKKYMNLYSIIPCFPNLADDPDSNISKILTDIYNTDPVHHPVKQVIRTRFVSTPCIIGFFSPIVFLPDLDFTQEELYCILYHELSHLRHMDFFWMLFTEILYMINWWNPFLRLLRTQLTEIMEFHADNTTFVNLPSTYQGLYLDCLVKVTRNQQSRSRLPAMTFPFSNNRSSSLKCRILRLIESESCGSFTNFFIMGTAALLLIASTVFIIEPSWMPPAEIYGESFGITNESYLLMQTDGSYEFYINDRYMGTIHDPNVEEIKELPIYYGK